MSKKCRGVLNFTFLGGAKSRNEVVLQFLTSPLGEDRFFRVAERRGGGYTLSRFFFLKIDSKTSLITFF